MLIDGHHKAQSGFKAYAKRQEDIRPNNFLAVPKCFLFMALAMQGRKQEHY